MKKICFAFVLFILFVPTQISLAQSENEINAKIEATKRERDALLVEQKRLEAALDALNTESQTLSGTIKTLDATRSKLTNDLKVTQNNISSTNLTIEKLENDIDKNEVEINTHRSAIKKSLQKLRTYDSYSLVYALLAYNSLDEVWSDTSNIMSLQDKLGGEIKLLENTQKSLAQNKAEREVQKTQLVSLSSQLKGQKEVADETRAVQAKLLADTKEKEIEHQKMLAETKARAEEFERLLTQFENELKISDQSLLPDPQRGILAWPLEKVFITQYFGYTPAARLLYKNTKHNGIDLRATTGTKILSARGGIVKGIGNTDEQRGCYSYGRWVLIEHDNGLSTLYAHLSSIIVSPGQAVSTRQPIGYSGGQPGAFGSGASTGPHLHFGVYASAGVRVARYESSANCKNVSIPLANPQDYLDPIAYLPKL